MLPGIRQDRGGGADVLRVGLVQHVHVGRTRLAVDRARKVDGSWDHDEVFELTCAAVPHIGDRVFAVGVTAAREVGLDNGPGGLQGLFSQRGVVFHGCFWCFRRRWPLEGRARIFWVFVVVCIGLTRFS